MNPQSSKHSLISDIYHINTFNIPLDINGLKTPFTDSMRETLPPIPTSLHYPQVEIASIFILKYYTLLLPLHFMHPWLYKEMSSD